MTADKLLEYSYMLANKVINSGFKPDFIVGIWRGGTPVGIAVQELLMYKGIKADHIAIRTSAYDVGIDNLKKEINVHGLSYIYDNSKPSDKILLVDDVFDTGNSMKAVLDKLDSKEKNLEIKIAVVYYKPSRNQTNLIPDFYIHETDKWLVFPHELDGLSLEQIKELKGEKIYNLIKD